MQGNTGGRGKQEAKGSRRRRKGGGREMKEAGGSRRQREV